MRRKVDVYLAILNRQKKLCEGEFVDRGRLAGYSQLQGPRANGVGVRLEDLRPVEPKEWKLI